MKRQAILLMSRGMRLHHYFRQIAEELRDDFEVVVTVQEVERPHWDDVGGVHVYLLDDVQMGLGFQPTQADREQVAHLEGKLNLPLFRAGSNFLLYKIFSKAYEPYGFRWSRNLETTEEIMGAYLGAWKVLSEIIERHDPIVGFFETIDWVSTTVAVAMMHSLDRFVFGFRYSPMGNGRIDLFYGVDRANVLLEHYFGNPADIPETAWAEASEFLARFRETQEGTTYAAVHREIHAQRARNVWGMLRKPSFYRRAIRQPAVTLRRARARWWMERNFTRDVSDDPYVFFPLQYQPEASTCSAASRWVHQPWIVEQLAISAPAGIRIMVKEHPRSFGSRGREYYEALTILPNVELVHPDVPTMPLLRGAEAVFTLTGATGFEAIVAGKPVVTLARPFYSIFPGVLRIDHPQDAFAALASFDPSEAETSLTRFIAANAASLHYFGQGSIETLFWPVDGGHRLAAALRKTLALVEQFGLSSASFAIGL